MNSRKRLQIFVERDGVNFKRPVDYRNADQKNYFKTQVELNASAIEKLFLGEYLVEEDGLANANVAETMK
jgi:hypothetical protein